MKNTAQIVLSGIRATGRLHLGNYLGALVRFARMSKELDYRCFFFVADMHTLTTLKEAEMIRQNLPEIVLDYLAAALLWSHVDGHRLFWQRREARRCA